MLHRAYRSLDEPRRVEGLTRDEVCVRFQDKVSLVARRVWDRLPRDAAVQFEDLVSWGAIGLLEAFDRFDAARGIRFSTFAEYRIRGAIFDALRSHDTFSRRRRQLARRVENGRESTRRKLGREGTPEEIAAELEMTLDEYHRAVDRTQSVSHVAMHNTDGTGRSYEETLSGPSVDSLELLASVQMRGALKSAIAALPERQRHCILMYYAREMSLAEIAAVYGVTASRISQILSASRNKLRKALQGVVDRSDLAQFQEAS